MSKNFLFLKNKFPSLEILGSKAEEYVFSDSNASLIKTGMLCENIINLMFSINHLIPPPRDYDNFAGRTSNLAYNGYLTKEQKTKIDNIRIMRNKAAHEGFASIAVAKIKLADVHGLAQWFMMVYGGDRNYKPEPFVKPDDTPASLAAKVQTPQQIEQEKSVEEKLFKEDLVKAQSSAAPDPEEIKKRSVRAENQRPKNEEETRELIDAQLRAVGWEADTVNLRYSKGTRPPLQNGLPIL